MPAIHDLSGSSIPGKMKQTMPKQNRHARTATKSRPPTQLGLQLAVINRPTFQPSRYQEDIFHFCVAGERDGLIVAAAGAGKTSTLIEVAQLLRADKTLFLAFNRSIADELRTRLANDEIDVLTVHGLGYRTICKQLGEAVIDKRKYRRLVRDWIDARFTRPGRAIDVTPEAQPRGPRPQVIRPEQIRDWYAALEALVNVTRLTLTDPADTNVLWELARRFGIPASGALLPGVADVLEEGARVAQQTVQVDYTDLLWLPHRLHLRPQRYKHVLVDEAQDLNAAQLALAMDARARGGRMLFCGDPHQSIYGWIGADPEAYGRIKTATGAVELPLSICYRCPSSHIALAQTLVPAIEPRPGAPIGTITLLEDARLLDEVRPGDLVICRKTAPLVAWCITLISHRIPARVRGREIGQELTKLARKLAQLVPWHRLPEAIAAYEEIEVAQLLREEVDEEHIIAVQDRCATLLVCFRSFGARSVDELCDEIDRLFADSGDFVALSTIHRAKGLEAERVFVLEANMLPLRWKYQRPDQLQQEMNLLYVALTRAKQELYLLLAPDTTQWNEIWAAAFRAAGVGMEEPLAVAARPMADRAHGSTG